MSTTKNNTTSRTATGNETGSRGQERVPVPLPKTKLKHDPEFDYKGATKLIMANASLDENSRARPFSLANRTRRRIEKEKKREAKAEEKAQKELQRIREMNDNGAREPEKRNYLLNRLNLRRTTTVSTVDSEKTLVG